MHHVCSILHCSIWATTALKNILPFILSSYLLFLCCCFGFASDLQITTHPLITTQPCYSFFFFFFANRDPKVCQLLLQAQYPVVAVDSYLPVVDIFSGGTRGSLRVFLAMGTSQQITALQRMRDEDLSSVSRLPRPVHLLDHRPIEDVKVCFLKMF